MNIKELEIRLKNENLLSVYAYGNKIEYIDGSTLYYDDVFHNCVNSFGIYTNGNKYRFFITDSERGIPFKGKVFASELEACDALYSKITNLNSIHIDTINDTLYTYFVKEKNLSENRAQQECDGFMQHIDIATEFANTIEENSWQFPRIKVEGFDAKELHENYPLSVMGAFNYLIYLREDPKEALDMLKKGLPRK